MISLLLLLAVVGVPLVLFLALLAWLERAELRARDRDDRSFREGIAHLPAEQQTRLWEIKLRRDAERDAL